MGHVDILPIMQYNRATASSSRRPLTVTGQAQAGEHYDSLTPGARLLDNRNSGACLCLELIKYSAIFADLICYLPDADYFFLSCFLSLGS